MKFRTLALATVFAALMGTASLHAEHMIKDHDHLNGYAKMTYSNLYLAAGETGGVGVSGAGNTTLRLSVYDSNFNLVNNTTCRLSNCILTFSANWSGNFYVTVENLSPYSTDYDFAYDRE